MRKRLLIPAALAAFFVLALGATAALAPSLLTALQSVNSSPNESGQFDDRQKVYNTELYNALQNLDQRVTALEEPGSPPPPPPPPPGLVINDFCDMAVPWNKNVINRYNTVLGDDPWYACDQATGDPWPSGGLFTDGVTTPFGQGFRAIVTPEMDVLSGGKIALFSDIGNIIPGNPGGLVQTWTGSFMFPPGQNPFPRNYPDWGVIWQLHGGGVSPNVGPLGLGVDTTEGPPALNNIYLNSSIGSSSNPTRRKARDPNPIVYGHWYEWKIEYKLSSGPNGYVKFWLDGRQMTWQPCGCPVMNGQTMMPGDNPYVQLGGFYSATQNRNEVLQGPYTVTDA
jgi:Polysaccharide lyase